MKQDKEGRRLCEYPYCRNYAESKGVRNGERRYRPWCERHRFVKNETKPAPKVKSKSTAPKVKGKVKTKAKPAVKSKVKAKAKGRARR